MSQTDAEASRTPKAMPGGLHGLRQAGAWLWRYRWFLLILAVLLASGARIGARIVFGPEVVVDAVHRGTLVQSVVVSGNVATQYRVEIGSQITGTVQEVLVEEGERVKKGQNLIAIEASELKANAITAQGALAQAEARMRQLAELTLPAAREQLTQVQATLTDARNAYQRAASLTSHGFETQANLDDARRNLDIAMAQNRSAELQVYTASPGGSDYVMAETQLAQARANLDTANARLGYATIAAPRDGVLITRSVERGTVVAPGKVLLVLAPDGETQLVLQVDERNLGSLALGQKALASADAYPDKRFQAVVAYINPGVDITRATVEVKLNVIDPPAYLIQDMTVSVDIEVARQENALILAARSVHDALSGSPWILAVRQGRAVQTPVRLGLHGDTQVEIAGGATAGDLAVPVGSGVISGQRVRPIVK